MRQPTVYVLEVNPRASRTVPFVSKATGVPLARLAALVMVGQDARRTGPDAMKWCRSTSRSRRACFPFNKFPGVDIILGPEMRSTGEVMGIDDSFPMAFAKSQMAANSAVAADRARLHFGGRPRQGRRWSPIARELARAGLSAAGDARHGAGAAGGGHPGARKCRRCRKAGRT